MTAGRQAMVRTAMPAAGVAVQPVVEADRRGPRGRVLAREAPRSRPRVRPVSRAVRSGVHSRARARSSAAPTRVPLEVVAVLEAVAEDDVHHRRGRGRASVPGQEGQVLVGLLRGPRAVGVDRHEPRAAPPRLLDEGPEVDVRAHDVGAPGHDEARVDDRLGVEADRLAAPWPCSPRRPRSTQMVRSSRLAPRAWKKRRSMLP